MTDGCRALVIVVLLLSSVVGATVTAAGGVDTSSEERGLDAPNSQADERTVSPDRLRSGIDASRGHLLNEFSGDHWFANLSYRNESAPRSVRLTLNYALMLELVDGSEQSQRDALGYALSRRSADGGWNDTVANHAALLLFREAYPGEYPDVAADVEREIDSQNMTLDQFEGTTFLNASFLTRVYYFLQSDRYDRSQLFDIDSVRGGTQDVASMTPAFEDGFDPDRRFLVPYTVVESMSSSIFLAEIRNNDSEAAQDRRELAAEVLLGRQSHDGNWEVAQGGVRAITALALQGYTTDDRSIRKGLAALERMQRSDGRLPPFAMSITDTADAHRTLHRTGVSKDNETLRRAAQWLVDARTTPPNGSNPAPAVMFRRHHGGGWGLIPSAYSDWDDTALAVEALSPYDDRVTADSVDFLFDVQNSDGSWTTYTTDFSPLTDRERERVIDTVGRETYRGLFVDPEANAVTAHALTALGKHGYTVENNESVRRAVSALLSNRSDDGLWGAAWYNDYTYGTAAVLMAFDDVGVDMSRTEVQQAAESIVERQNPDGGWGEQWTPDEPDYHRWSESSVEQTAWAVQALLAAGLSPDHSAVARGVDYLLDEQRADGSWKVEPAFKLGGGVPTYRNPVLTQTGGLLALTMYAEARDVPTAPRESADGVALLPEPELAVPLAVLTAVVAAVLFRRLFRRRRADSLVHRGNQDT